MEQQENPAPAPQLVEEPVKIPQRSHDDRFRLGKREISLIFIIVAALIAVGLFALQLAQRKQNEANSIDSFQECVAAGNPVMESYPEQCAANGRTFTNTAQQIQPQ